MAEFLNQTVEPALSPMNATGKVIPATAREAAYEHCKQMGLDQARAYECVSSVAEQLERDHPYEAQAAGMRFLDLTGVYRLVAVLLANTPIDSPARS
ncbi:hypothetical protein D3C71_25180 [compost metagenome]